MDTSIYYPFLYLQSTIFIIHLVRPSARAEKYSQSKDDVPPSAVSYHFPGALHYRGLDLGKSQPHHAAQKVPGCVHQGHFLCGIAYCTSLVPTNQAEYLCVWAVKLVRLFKALHCVSFCGKANAPSSAVGCRSHFATQSVWPFQMLYWNPVMSHGK